MSGIACDFLQRPCPACPARPQLATMSINYENRDAATDDLVKRQRL